MSTGLKKPIVDSSDPVPTLINLFIYFTFREVSHTQHVNHVTLLFCSQNIVTKNVDIFEGHVKCSSQHQWKLTHKT